MRWTRVLGGCGAAFKKARAQGNLGVRVVEGAARFPARRSGGRCALEKEGSGEGDDRRGLSVRHSGDGKHG